MKLNKDEKKGIKELSNKLQLCFVWDESPQGYNYWEKVNNNLIKLIKK